MITRRGATGGFSPGTEGRWTYRELGGRGGVGVGEGPSAAAGAMDFPLGPVERLHFGDSSELAGIVDPGYMVLLEEEGAVSVVAAVCDVPGDDEADSVAKGG